MNKKVLLIILFVFILAAIPLTVYLVKTRQEIRKKASTPTGTATVSLTPASGRYSVGESIPINIYFNPVSVPMSSIAIRITYPFSGSSPLVVASNLEINPALVSTGNWMCPVKTITPVGGRVEIDISCANVSTEGFTAASDTLLASFNLIANEVPTVNPVVLRFDSVESKIQSKIDNADILLTPASEGSYTIGEMEVTATPVPPTNTPPPGATNTPVPPTNTPPPGATNTPVPPTPTTASNSNGGSGNTPVNLTSISSGVNPPSLAGSAAAGAKITITIQSNPITGTVYADAAGNWSWTPPSELESGSHTATVTATDSAGNTTTDSASFTVATGDDLPETGFLTPTVLSLLSGLLLLFLGLSL